MVDRPAEASTPVASSPASRATSGAVVLRPGLPTAWQPLGLARHVSTQSLGGGGLLLRAPRGQLTLGADDAALLRLLDGQVRLADFLAAAQARGLSPLRGVDLLRRLADAAALGQQDAAGFVAQDADKTTSSNNPHPLLALPWLPLAAALVLALIGLTGAQMAGGDLGPAQLARLSLPALGLGVLSWALRLAMRRALVVASRQAGHAPTPAAQVARQTAAAGLVALALPAVAVLLTRQLGLTQLFDAPTAALLVTLVGLSLGPWLPGDAAQWMGASIGAHDFAARVRRFLTRKHARNLTRSGAPAKLEAQYIDGAALSLLHAFGVLGPLAVGALPALINQLAHVLMPQSTTSDLVSAGVSTVVVLVLVGLLLWFLSRLFVGLATQLTSVRPRESMEAGAPASDEEVGQLTVALRELPFLGPLDDAAIAALARQGRRASYRPATRILVQGAPGDRLCWLAQGRVRVLLEDESGAEREVATLYPGAFFGETALLAPVPRTASVVADGPVEVLSLSRPAFLDALAKVQANAEAVQREIRTAAAVRSHPLFQGLGPEALRDVLRSVRVQHLAAGATAVEQGTEGDAMYAVVSGQLRVERDGKRLAELTAGGFFGELALLGDGRRTASVVAAEAADVVELPRAAVEAAILHDPQAALALLDAASERFGALQAGGAA